LGGHPNTHILGDTFYTMAPLLYGHYYCKIAVVPVSPQLAALTGAKITVAERPNALRDETSRFFSSYGGVWELRVQVCTNRKTMPIEDASIPWPQEESPYVAAARITVSPQPSWTEARAGIVDDAMAFSPWHGVTAHRPLGGIMRSRRQAYQELSSLRSALNRCPLREPKTSISLPT
jgi:hypothetical protein